MKVIIIFFKEKLLLILQIKLDLYSTMWYLYVYHRKKVKIVSIKNISIKFILLIMLSMLEESNKLHHSIKIFMKDLAGLVAKELVSIMFFGSMEQKSAICTFISILENNLIFILECSCSQHKMILIHQVMKIDNHQ